MEQLNQYQFLPFPISPRIGEKFTRRGFDPKTRMYRDITYVFSIAHGKVLWLADIEPEEEGKED